MGSGGEAAFPAREEGDSSSSSTNSSEFLRCVQCGFAIKTRLYIQYSPGNIRLMKCGNCNSAADEYIECEVMILIIDLILHKAKAYRHLFYNSFDKDTVNLESLFWKFTLVFLVLDIYRIWVLSTDDKEWASPASAALLMDCGKMLIDVIFGNLVFLLLMLHGTRKLLNASAGYYGWKHILLVVFVSSYFKIFLMAMMVWKFPSSVIFIIDMFVLSSNIVALKVMTNSSMMRCLTVCAVAHSVKFLAGQGKVFALQS